MTGACHDDISDHLKVLFREFQDIVREQESVNAVSAAAAHHSAMMTCQRFLVTAPAPEASTGAGRALG